MLPSVEHEITRRRVSNGVLEMWFYVQSELLKLATSSKKNQTMLNNLQSIYNMTAEHYTSDMMLLIQEYVIYVMMTTRAPESKQFERDYEKIEGVNTVFRMLFVHYRTKQTKARRALGAQWTTTA